MTFTVDHIQTWLHNVTYRPGWTIDYAGYVYNNHYIRIAATAPNVCKPNTTFHTSPLFRIPDNIHTQAEFLDWVIDTCLPGVETHERYEWFRVDGQCWRDPHSPDMPAFATDFAVSNSGYEIHGPDDRLAIGTNRTASNSAAPTLSNSGAPSVSNSGTGDRPTG